MHIADISSKNINILNESQIWDVWSTQPTCAAMVSKALYFF